MAKTAPTARPPRRIRTIGNPLSWTARALVGSGAGLGTAAGQLGAGTQDRPVVRRLGYADLFAALRAGLADLGAFRSDVIFIVAIYPVAGLILSLFLFNQNMLPLFFPLASGFALLGPVAALVLYEMSRRREAGEPAHWGAALSGLRARNLAPVLMLGLYLLAIFTAWMFTANWIWRFTLGPVPPESIPAFAAQVAFTPAGWAMTVLGLAAGAIFAALVLVISLTAFPMLLDRPVGLPRAVATSVEVARKNPGPVLAWGGIVAGLLVLGSVPVFLGLILVLPVLGHGTWHLYRRAIGWEDVAAPPEA